MKDKACLLLTPQEKTNSEGLKLLSLQIWTPTKETFLAQVSAVSGQPFAQKLLRPTERTPGSFTPLPEGAYTLGPLEWASGKEGDFSGSFGAGLGPIWSLITPGYRYVVNPCQSYDFGIHPDWNEATSPGTAGCVGIQGETGSRDLERLKTICHWFMSYKIEFLYVHYNKGWSTLTEFHRLRKELGA